MALEASILPNAKKAFLALITFSWTDRRADRLWLHQTRDTWRVLWWRRLSRRDGCPQGLGDRGTSVLCVLMLR